MIEDQLYFYRATVVSIYDADTVRLDIDLGLGVSMNNKSVRLTGIDAPEIRGEERPEGIDSKNALIEKLPISSKVLIKTELDKTGKYGRLLATIFLDGENINQWLIDNGHAEPYK